jgi:tetraacyldisaccharide 4'-kinase
MDIIDLRSVKPPDELSPHLRKALVPLLFPLSGIYGSLMRLRRAAPPRRTDVGIPVVSVGSLAVGGTGKTPLCMWIADRFSALGSRVFILSRGYRRRRGPSPLVVSDGRDVLVDVHEAGDEPYMMARHLRQVGVVVGKNRLTAALEARNYLGADLLVLDDGFQERRLHHSVDVLCFEPATLRSKNAPLPLGTLREGWSAIGPEDLVVIRLDRPDSRPPEREVEHLRGAGVFYHADSEPQVVDSEFRIVEDGGLRRHGYVLVSGIGRPAAFEGACGRVEVDMRASIRFQDHHWYTDQDTRTIEGLMERYGADRILTTEKDIWKFPAGLREISLILTTRIDFLDRTAFLEAVDTKMKEAL